MRKESEPEDPKTNGIWRYCMNKKHVFFYKLVRPVIVVFLWLKFGYTFTVARNLPENYIVLSNHTTDYDPLFLGASFPRQMYFVGSEHIARWKHWYELLKSCFAPIMRPKGTLGASTTMEVLRKVPVSAFLPKAPAAGTALPTRSCRLQAEPLKVPAADWLHTKSWEAILQVPIGAERIPAADMSMVRRSMFTPKNSWRR